jgi:hypothetical protein
MQGASRGQVHLQQQRGLPRYMLDLLVIEKVIWDKGALKVQELYIFFCMEEGKFISWKQNILYYTEKRQLLRE